MNSFSTTPKAQDTITSLWKLEKIILDTLDFNDVVQKIVDSVLSELGYLNLGYCIIVLTLIDEKQGILKRVSISKTVQAQKALEASPIPFNEINIPLNETKNLLIRALNSKTPMTSTSLYEVLCPPLSPDVVTSVQRSLGIKGTMVYPVSSKGKIIGSLIFSLLKTPDEVSPEEKDLLASFTDVVGIAVENAKLYSSLNETTLKLKEANEQLKNLDKLKDEFVSLASHELRTPMTVIKSYIWMFLHKKGDDLDEKEKTYLVRAYTTTERLIKLVNDMLNVSRIESGRLQLEMKDLDIAKLVNTVVDELISRAKELGLTLTYEKPTEAVKMVNGDADRIEEVLINFIGNSLKFTPPGGFIKVKLETREKDILISIADNGKGIKKEDMPKLFQKFQTMGNAFLQKQQNQGSGLGLYLSKSLVELHGGRVSVESAGENKGAKFSFTIPYNENKAHQEAAVLPSGPSGAGVVVSATK